MRARARARSIGLYVTRAAEGGTWTFSIARSSANARSSERHLGIHCTALHQRTADARRAHTLPRQHHSSLGLMTAASVECTRDFDSVEYSGRV